MCSVVYVIFSHTIFLYPSVARAFSATDGVPVPYGNVVPFAIVFDGVGYNGYSCVGGVLPATFAFFAIAYLVVGGCCEQYEGVWAMVAYVADERVNGIVHSLVRDTIGHRLIGAHRNNDEVRLKHRQLSAIILDAIVALVCGTVVADRVE